MVEKTTQVDEVLLRGGNSNSTPPKGLNSSWIAVPRPFSGTACRPTASRRISRTPSSMERPFPAARLRSRIFTSSSRLRIVMLAMSRRSVSTSNGSLRSAGDAIKP
ncbi:MAG: hypothetical protein J4F40_10995 [Alphaproteobacteria bacterium]|nr:hypothetical protein [Alphaproteobacteria bacterium]